MFALGLVLINLWCKTRLGILKTDQCLLEGTFEEGWDGGGWSLPRPKDSEPHCSMLC